MSKVSAISLGMLGRVSCLSLCGFFCFRSLLLISVWQMEKHFPDIEAGWYPYHVCVSFSGTERQVEKGQFAKKKLKTILLQDSGQTWIGEKTKISCKICIMWPQSQKRVGTPFPDWSFHLARCCRSFAAVDVLFLSVAAICIALCDSCLGQWPFATVEGPTSLHSREVGEKAFHLIRSISRYACNVPRANGLWLVSRYKSRGAKTAPWCTASPSLAPFLNIHKSLYWWSSR